jgi:predicted permease
MLECRRVGEAAIPCMMVSLGGALSNGPGDSHVPYKAILALVVIRLVILPAVGGWAVLAGAPLLLCGLQDPNRA